MAGPSRRIVVLRRDDTPPRGLFADVVFQDLAGVADLAVRRQRTLDAARNLNNLAMLLQRTNRRLKAGRLMERAIAIYTRRP